MKNKKWFLAELIFALSTGIVILYAALHQQDAFAIFTSYVVVVGLLSVGLTIYWQLDRTRMMEQNRARMTYFMEHLSTPAMFWNGTVTYMQFNPKLRELLGMTEEEPVTKELLLQMFGLEALNEEAIQALLQNTNGETRILTRSGTELVMIWSTSGLEYTATNCYFMSVGFDVSLLRAMQHEIQDYSAKLAMSEERYALSVELSEIGIILTELGSETYVVSPELQRIFGLQGVSISYSDFRRRVHPNDMVIFDTYQSSMNKLMQPEENRVHSIEFRLRTAEGEYRWYTYRYKAANLATIEAPVIGGSLIDISKEKEKDALIEHIAYVDEVTGISNRNKLMLMGQETFTCSVELGVSYWVMVIDIDRFHLVNDTCGYENGNKMLRNFAHILYKYLSFGGFGARISGDNFALIMRDYGDEELPVKTMERIQADLAQLTTETFSTKAMTCSAGYSRMPRDGACFEEVLEHAEFALSSGEKQKASVIAYDISMHAAIIGESQIEKELAEAIDNGELELYYQPKISLSNGRIIGVEALIRWIRPDGTVVQPGSFVPIAETSHLIRRISQYVLNEACEQNRIWQKMGLPNIVVSINLTSADFYQGNVREAVYEALARTGLDAQWLEVELTESLAIKDLDLALDQMNQLRQMGVKLAMDDFGTGYSSLSYIQVLPITLLKLDRSFVMNLEEDEIAREIVSSVIRIAKSKHIETIAEGIETPEQARLLRIAGCDHAQGFLYGKPMPHEAIEEYMRRNITERLLF